MTKATSMITTNETLAQLVYDIGNKRYINIGKTCTLRCTFCPKQQGHWQVHEYNLKLARLPTASQIIEALGDIRGVEEVVFCGYSEPTLRLKVLLQVAQWVKSQGERVRVNTDGLGNLAHQRNILPDLTPVVDALSISLNAQNETIYIRHCKPQLPGAYHSLREFIALAPQCINSVTVTAIAGLEGVDIDACAAIAKAASATFRRRELDIVG